MRFITLGLLVAAACSLPTDSKTGCVKSADCVDARACVDGTCRDAACEWACSQVCELQQECGAEAGDCESDCLDPSEVLQEGLSTDQCAAQVDRLDEEDCSSLDCYLGCRIVCETAADCSLISDPQLCALSCQDEADTCPSPTPVDCLGVPTLEIICWSLGLPAAECAI